MNDDLARSTRYVSFLDRLENIDTCVLFDEQAFPNHFEQVERAIVRISR